MNKTEHRAFTRNDLPAHARETIITLLNQHLADTLDLYTQVKQAHWNVKGMHFIQLHLLFDQIADPLLEYTDSIAERITSLGGKAMGTARMAAAHSQLEEFPAEFVEGKQVLEVLAQRYAVYSSTSREAIGTTDELGDPVTADLFTEISRTIDKHLWMLEAHLQD
jgi:starvation-inducible DNA-binding protein